MSVPLAEYLGSARDAPEGKNRIHDAFGSITTLNAACDCAVDPAILAIDEPEVLALRGARAIDRELLVNMLQHFIFEARR